MLLHDWKAEGPIVERISRAIQEHHIFHAYIIEGDTCVDKVAFAKDMAKAILCREKPGFGCDQCLTCRKINHDAAEDLYLVCSDGLSVKDEAIAQLQENLKRKPIGGDRNLAIIRDADTMTVRAQNRLLKTLEEPPVGTVIFLLSENSENLLPTIRSRCVTCRLNRLDATEAADRLREAEAVMEGLLGGWNFFRMKEVLRTVVKSREDAFRLLDGLERLYRDFLMDKDIRGRAFRRETLLRHIALIEEARRDLLLKVNYNYAIKNLVIKIGG